MSASAQKPPYQNHPNAEFVVHSDNGSKPRILVVDEQAHILRVLRSNLERDGYLVDMALSSESALSLMQVKQHDVLIITSDLPDMNAWQLCDNVENQLGKDSPLILVSAGQAFSWKKKIARIERLAMPVSLKQIVGRLHDEFATVD